MPYLAHMKFTLKRLMDHLNDINSLICIVNVDTETGVITLSNNNSFNVNDLNEPKDVEQYINVVETNQTFVKKLNDSFA